MERKNYLAMLYGKEEIETGDVEINPENGYEFKICGEEYKDPDMESDELYVDWCEYLESLDLPDSRFELNLKEHGISARIGDRSFVLGSDYIGPSKYWTSKVLLEKSDMGLSEVEGEIAYILDATRRFEGHMIWPRMTGIGPAGSRISYGPCGKNSINMSRGGRNGVYDRIDITLILLKKYYELFIEDEGMMNEPVHIMDRAETFMLGCKDFIDLRKNSGRLFNLFLAFELAYDWLKIFDSYDRFIEAFKLKPLADRGIIEEIRTAYIGDMLSGYRTYADICTEAIKERGRL